MNTKVHSLKHDDVASAPKARLSNLHSGHGMDRQIERRVPKWARAAAIAAAIVLTIVIGLMVLMPEGGRTLRVQGDRVVVSTVTRGQFEDFIPVRGRVTPLKTIYLDAIEGGRVEEVLVEDGTAVEAGQLIVKLSNTALQLDVIAREAEVTEQLNNLNTLELQLEQNRLNHRRTLVQVDYDIKRLGRLVERREQLMAKGHVSQQDLDDVQDELNYREQLKAVTLEAQKTDERLQNAQMVQLRESADTLKRNLVVARRNLDALNVRAPVAGKLTALNADVGQSLSRGERIGQIDDPENFKLTALIDEFYLPRVDIGQTARVEVAGRAYELEIVKIYPQVRNGQFEVDLVFGGDTPSGIRRGQTLQTKLSLGDPSPALLIPNGAFYQDTGGNWVFVIASDGSAAVRRTVKLGRRNARFIEVLDGLETGEKVITSPYTSYLEMQRLDLQD
ncbi:MAG: efflux RND transporter periplasmic adaptor subunit [Pseudomonadota bacterium]